MVLSFRSGKLLVETYPWYNMTTTARKVIIRGALIIKSAILPIRQLSEDTPESRNKNLKSFLVTCRAKVSKILSSQALQ